MKKLWNKDLTLLLLGQSISRLGDSAHYIALMWFILEKTGSSTVMGTLSALAYIPSLILSPFAGVVADRYSRKKIIILLDFLRGIMVFILALLFFTKGLTILGIFVLTILLSISSAFFNPCIPSSIPEMVEPENLPRANSLFSIAGRIAEVLGPSIGGIAYKILGAGYLFTFNAISFFIAAIFSLFIRIPQKFQEGKMNFVLDIKEVFLKIKEDKELMSLGITASILNFFYVPFFVLLPVYIKNYLNFDASVYDLVLGIGGIGSLIGLLITSMISPSGNGKYNLFRFSLIGQGASCGLLVLPLEKLHLMTVFFIIQLLNIFVNIYLTTTFQLMIPTQERGRFFGILGLFTGGLMPIAMSLAGIIAEFVRIPIIYGVCTCIILCVSWRMIKIRALKKLFLLSDEVNNP